MPSAPAASPDPPEIGIVKIDHHPHARLRRPDTCPHRLFQIAVPAAIAMSLCIIGIVPHAQPHIIDALIRQKVKKSLIVQLIPLIVVKTDTALPLCHIGGNVRSEQEILRQSLHPLHIQLRFRRSEPCAVRPLRLRFLCLRLRRRLHRLLRPFRHALPLTAAAACCAKQQERTSQRKSHTTSCFPFHVFSFPAL